MLRAMSDPSAGCPGCAAVLPLLHETGTRLERTVLVGVGGPGGSGKSSFARELDRRLADSRVLPLDDYRKPRDERPPGIYGSHPEGNRIDLLKLHLQAARDGLPFERPVYDTKCGTLARPEPVPPARFLIAEGEIAAHRALRSQFDLRILVLAGWSLQWSARMGRDRSERASSLRKAIAVFLRSNLRDYPRFSAGARREADLVVRRTRDGRFLPLA